MANREVIADLVAQVSLDGAKFTEGIGKVNRQLKLVQEEFKTTQTRTKQFGQSTDNLSNQSQILANQIKLQKTSVQLLDKAYQEAVASGGAFSKNAQNLAIRLEKAKREMMGTQKQLADVNREIVEQNGLLVTNQGLWGKSFSDLKGQIGESIDGLQNLQRVMAGGLIAAGVGFGAAVYSAATFEQALADVKAISGASGEEMKQLAELAKDLGESTRYSGKQVLEGAQELIKAGVPLEKVLGGALKSALDLATAGELDLASAAEIASTALNAFEQDNLTVANAADILAGAANASATDVQEMRIGLAQSAAVASATGFTFEETATALAVLAQNGLKGSDAGTSLRTMMLRLVPETNKAKDAMKQLGLMTEDGSNNFFDAEGNVKDFSEVVQILHDSLDDLSPEERSAALKELFGQDAYRAGAIFFKDAAAGLQEMNEAMSKTTAAEVAKVRMDTFMGSLEEMKSTLATLGIEIADDAMGGLTDTVKELTEWVRDLDPEMVAIGLKAVGAAAGFGLLATTLLRVGRGLTLLSRNPMGLAITGISLLVGAFVGLKESAEAANKVSFEHIRTMQGEIEQTEIMIDRFEELEEQNKLTKGEMLRYLDILAELDKTKSPDKIKALKDEQNKLLGQSTLTNDEMQEFVDLNNEIIQQAPSTKQAISEEGQAYVENTKKIKEMTQAKIDDLKLAARGELRKALGQIEEKEREVNDLIKERQDLYQTVQERYVWIAEQNDKIEKQKQKINEMQEKLNGGTSYELENQKQTLRELERQLERYEDQTSEKEASYNETVKDLEAAQAKLGELQNHKYEYEQIILDQVDLNAKQGEGLQVIKDQLDILRGQKLLLDDKFESGKLTYTQYQEQNKKLDEQIGKLEAAKDELNQINQTAGETIYQEHIITTRNMNESYWETLNRELGKDITKRVFIQEMRGVNDRLGLDLPGYASGTDFHPGGLAWVGERGKELVWLPRGAQVATHEESMKLANNIPGYANGTGLTFDKEGEPRIVTYDDSTDVGRIRSIRQSEIDLLEKQIEYLTRESATLEDINRAKETQVRLEALRGRKMDEFQNKIKFQQQLIEDINKTQEQGKLTQEQYNELLSEASTELNNVKSEMVSFNGRNLEEINNRLEEMAKKAADVFDEFSSNGLDAYSSAMEKEVEAMREAHEEKLRLFDEETKARVNSINAQIEAVNRKREAELEAVNEQLRALDQQEKQFSRDEQEEDWTKERGDLQHRLEVAQVMGDDRTVRDVQREIEAFEEQVFNTRRQWQTEDKREELFQEQDRIAKKYDMRVEELNKELEIYEEQRAIQRSYLEETLADKAEAFEEEIALQQKRFDTIQEQLVQAVANGEMTQAQAHEAWMKAIVDLGNEQVIQEMANQEKSKLALQTYVKDYMKIGQSYGNGLVDGLVGVLQNRMGEVSNMVSRIKSMAASVSNIDASTYISSEPNISVSVQNYLDSEEIAPAVTRYQANTLRVQSRKG